MYCIRASAVRSTVMPTVRHVTFTAPEVVLVKHSDANSKASNVYCIRAIAVVGIVMSTLREVTGTA